MDTAIVWAPLIKVALREIRFKSEDVEGFSNLQKYIPNYYLKFIHPVHDVDKISFQTFFAFTDLVYLQVVQIILYIWSILKNKSKP